MFEYIKISEIKKISDKGLNMTLAEKNILDNYLFFLSKTHCSYDSYTKVTIKFTSDQLKFIQHSLISFIKNDVPKLDQVLSIYGLNIDTIFVYEH